VLGGVGSLEGEWEGCVGGRDGHACTRRRLPPPRHTATFLPSHVQLVSAEVFLGQLMTRLLPLRDARRAQRPAAASSAAATNHAPTAPNSGSAPLGRVAALEEEMRQLQLQLQQQAKAAGSSSSWSHGGLAGFDSGGGGGEEEDWQAAKVRGGRGQGAPLPPRAQFLQQFVPPPVDSGGGGGGGVGNASNDGCACAGRGSREGGGWCMPPQSSCCTC
jgi:hypothetical protein